MAEGADAAWIQRPGQALDMKIWSGPGREFEAYSKGNRKALEDFRQRDRIRFVF